MSKQQRHPADKPAYEVQLLPEDGLYPLPYMAVQAERGSAWEEECTFAGAPEAQARQGFFPDGSRSSEEIDRLQIGEHGSGNLISEKADIDFYRVLPPAGYTKVSRPIVAPIRATATFHPSAAASTSFRTSRRISRVGAPTRSGTGNEHGATDTGRRRLRWCDLDRGQPAIEEQSTGSTCSIDTTVPICGNAAQRLQGLISNDGPKNIVDSVDYISSRSGPTTGP